MESQKRERIFEKEFWDIVKEIIGFSIFLFFLYFVAYSNLSKDSIYYNQLYKNTFVKRSDNSEIALNEVNRKF